MLKLLCRNSRNVFKRTRYRKLNFYSTKPAPIPEATSESQSHNQLLKDIGKMTKLKIKVRTKKPQRGPFIKNCFLGNFDTDILTYPELGKDESNDLKEILQPIEDVFSTELSRDDYFSLLKRLNLTGLQVPQLLGGQELTVTESCKIEESIYNNFSTALSYFNNEHIGIQTLLKFGTHEQRSKYLPMLSTGDMFSTFGVSEGNSPNSLIFNTEAKLSEDEKYWIINGEKSCVINGVSADLFILFAKTYQYDRFNELEGKITAFLVERSFGGISHTPCDSLGLKESNIVNVQFNNTRVPVENLLGELHKGDTIVSKLLMEMRLGIGTACIPLTRKILKGLIDYSKETSNGTIYLSEADITISKIGKISSWLYAMESMTYLTSQLLDQYENQDCELEAAIVKAFNSKFAHKSAVEALQFIGQSTYMTDHWLNQLHNDALAYRLFHEPNDNLAIVIAILGLQHAGIHLNEMVNKVRNPFYNTFYVVNKFFTQRRQIEDNPKLNLRLKDYLHPSLSVASEWLEYCVLRLQFATDQLLIRHGPKVVSQHMELERIAECATYIYAMTACLGRASRSYCIGLRNSETEMFITIAFCLEAKNLVKEHVLQIINGRFSTSDEFYTKVAKQTFQSGKYFAEHPLTRNF